MNIYRMQTLANNCWAKYIGASHVYNDEHGRELELHITIPAHSFNSADFPYNSELSITLIFDEYSYDSFREFLLDPIKYCDHLNELGALNIDSLMYNGIEVRYYDGDKFKIGAFEFSF
jgi:hypothetical protein